MVPSDVVILLYTLAIIFMLSYFFGGIDFGPIKIPKLQGKTRFVVPAIGFFLFISLLASPIYSTTFGHWLNYSQSFTVDKPHNNTRPVGYTFRVKSGRSYEIRVLELGSRDCVRFSVDGSNREILCVNDAMALNYANDSCELHFRSVSSIVSKHEFKASFRVICF